MQTTNIINLLAKKFVGTDELRKNLTKILNTLHKEGEIIITQHGKPKAVLIDILKYQRTQNILNTSAKHIG